MRNSVYVGDNLQIMQSNLFKKYRDKIGLIYIDPPYNTQTAKSYNDRTASEEWYDFMHQRLKCTLDLMKEDAVILISIDDNEYANLKICCDNVFGCDNFVGTLITKQSQRSNAKLINTVHEYILAYAKNKKKCPEFKVKRIDTPEGKKNFDAVSTYGVFSIATNPTFEDALKDYRRWLVNFCKANDLSWLRNYNYIDEVGTPYFATDLSTPGKPRTVDIPEIGLHLDPLPTRGWSSDEKFKELHKAGRLIFRDGRPYAIHYLEEAEDSAPSILDFYSRQGNEDMKRLGLDGIFDTPKPVNMLKYLLRITGVKEGVVMDFFAGSGSFCQATEEVNREDKKSLQCILIQLDEDIAEGTESYERCKELGIEPNIPAVLEARLKKVGCDYEIFR